jgi:NAD(P)-dependent dehydrogenase (short-subunit alcohol dehydrogenase family)
MNKELEDKVAIITGASSGIGLSTARLFVASGARVAALARRIHLLEELAVESKAIVPIHCDVSDEQALAESIERVEREVGAVEILVNNAGFIRPRRVVEMSNDDWDSTFAINCRAVFVATRQLLPRMLERNRGSIINIASISGVAGPQKFPGFAAYCAAKAAVIAFTEAVASEVEGTAVRINAVSPGSVDTPMLKQANENLTPDMTAAEVAETILYLATDRSRPMNGRNIQLYGS